MEIPKDALLNVLEFLPVSSICAVLRTAKSVRNAVIDDDSLWKMLYQRRFLDCFEDHLFSSVQPVNAIAAEICLLP